MINLLPSQQKEELLQEERLKIILILIILFLSFLISLFLILFSIKISLTANLEIQNSFLKEREREISLNGDLEEKIKNYNKILVQLNSFYEGKTDLTNVLEKIFKTLPQNTYLTNFALISQKEKSILSISLSGFSPERDTLLELKRNLEKEKSFFEIYFPPENWVKPKDIQFNVNFKVRQ